MNKRITLSNRKRTRELAPHALIEKQEAKREEQLAQLRNEVEADAHPISQSFAVEPCAPTTLTQTQPFIIPSFAITLEEMLEELTQYSKMLQQTSIRQSDQDSLREHKKMLMQQIATFINQRAEQLENKGIIGKSKKMQCEALLYSIAEGLKKRNIDMSGVRLVEF